LNSALAVQQANLKQAGIDLAKTTIKAPFDCRLGDVNMEVGQFVRAGQLLFKAHGTAVTQIEARFRTVLLTSSTPIAGLLPLLFERSLQAQILIPLVISTSFGLMASTVLVLLAIPCMYLILGDLGMVEKLSVE